MHISERLRPTQSHILWGGAVEIHCFGRAAGDWAPDPAGIEATRRKNPDFVAGMVHLRSRLGISRIYMPHPSDFNGVVRDTSAFHDVWLKDILYRGPKADGAMLTEPGQAFAVASADCPTAVLYDARSGHVAAAHAGFRSMLELGSDEVIAWSMWEALGRHTGRRTLVPRETRGFIACGIGPSYYDFDPSHPRFTEAHRRQVEEAHRVCPDAVLDSDGGWMIDMSLLLRTRIDQTGTAMESIGCDGACTYSDTDRAGEPLWHSNRRGDASRNLVLVIRR